MGPPGIGASQFGIRAQVYDYLGLDGKLVRSSILMHFGELDVMCDLILCCVLCEIVCLGKWHIGTYCLALPMNA